MSEKWRGYWAEMNAAATPVARDLLQSWELFLTSVSYKPGWAFSAYAHKDTIYLVAISMEPNSRKEGDREQYREFGVGPVKNMAQMVAYVRKAVQTWELHEADEFLTVNGKRLHDPHLCAECSILIEGHHVVENPEDVGDTESITSTTS